jgi:hypothetical protein
VRIENIHLAKAGNKARLSARLTWEDCGRPSQEIFFEVEEPFCDALVPTPHAFLVPALIPAMRHGEKRILVDEPICPELWDGLDVVMAWIHQWGGASRMPLRIDARAQTSLPAPQTPDRAGCMFTGGVDSMATLRRNRLRFPIEHPWSIRDGIIIFGLEVDRLAAFDQVLHALSPVAKDANLQLLPVYTNVRTLDLDWQFWEFEWEGSVYSAVAHALSKRLTVVSIGATYDVPHMNQLGSHPLLDHNYSSTTLRVRHDGLTHSRFEKTKLLTEWQAGLDHLRVCNTVDRYRPETINCGQCEKCVRTMLALSAVGALERARSFSAQSLDAKLVREVGGIYSPYMESCYQELLAPLEARARHDLAGAIHDLLSKYRSQLEPEWRGVLRRWDEKHLNGLLRRWKHGGPFRAPAASASS